ncbi:hypothetical protein GCM10010360_48870 [Streptomyces nogalater]
MATANIGQNMTTRLDGPPPRSAPGRAAAGAEPDTPRQAAGHAAAGTPATPPGDPADHVAPADRAPVNNRPTAR